MLQELIQDIRRETKDAQLVAVSKFQSNERILEIYSEGQRVFGENRVQELVEKYEALPKDIDWHLIGHLQKNKVKYIAPFVGLIHSVDSEGLLNEIEKRAVQNSRMLSVLLQVHVGTEQTKFGVAPEEIDHLLYVIDSQCPHVCCRGLMTMATNTEDLNVVGREFETVYTLFKAISSERTDFDTLSMGMSGDYKLALEKGSNMVRIGSKIFGKR